MVTTHPSTHVNQAYRKSEAFGAEDFTEADVVEGVTARQGHNWLVAVVIIVHRARKHAKPALGVRGHSALRITERRNK